MIDPRPNLGVDLDGVVCNLWDSFRAEIMKKYNIFLDDIEAQRKYNVSECSELTRKQVERIFKEGKNMYKNLSMITGARIALTYLKTHYKIHIITHRNFYKGIEADTRSWLDRNEIRYDKITFTNSDKIQQVLNADCKYMIEDCGETAIKLVEAGQKVILLNYLYNRDFNHRLITRMKSWKEIVEILI